MTITYGASATLTNDSTGSKIVFSTAEVLSITLWNSDATGAQRFEEVFQWDAGQSAYALHHYA